MPAPVQARLVLLVAATAAALAVFLTACGGDSGGSRSDPADLAPAESPLFIEAILQPEGELKANVEDLAKSIAGVENLGDLIVSELESSATDSDEELDFEKEVAPWLGENGGLFFQEFDGEDFHRYGIAVQTTDAEAAQAFIDKQSAQSDDPVQDGSYEEVDYVVESDDGTTIGVIEGFLAIAEDEQTFKTMVDSGNGLSLGGEARYTETVDAAADGSFADVYVDIGGLIDRSGGAIDPDAKQFLDSAGIEPGEATAVASLIPGSNQIEIELSSDLAGENPPSGDASDLLGALPADSVAAVALADFGDRVGEALDEIDANGIPGEVPPGKFKSALKAFGIDVEKIAGSIGSLGVFAEGSSKRDLAGAAVLETSNADEARNTVSNIGLLLRSTGVSGVTAVSGKVSGFSIRDREDLGDKPLVIAAKGERIAVAYGLLAATRALNPSSANTLADSPAYKEAVSALGGTPISGFADGRAALEVASSLLVGSDDEQDFKEAKPYLAKIAYLAIGSTSAGDLATAKLIAGISK
jgi:Protein of unknown function (DUF3352)